MRFRLLRAAFVACVTLASASIGAVPDTKPASTSGADVDKLIAQLGDRDFAARETADKKTAGDCLACDEFASRVR